MSFNYEQMLDVAAKTPVLSYEGILREQGMQKIQSASALMFLILDEVKNGATVKYHDRILLHLRNIIKSGKEPVVDCNHFWSYVPLTFSIAVAKNTDGIWSEFSEEEKAKFDFLMTSFAVITNYIANDQNFYKTGISRRGDTDKNWNPNYKLSLVAPIVACSVYFGGSDKLDNILLNFDYNNHILKMQQYGFTNMSEIWEAESFYNADSEVVISSVKSILEDGGQNYIVEKTNTYTNIYDGGKGLGAKIPFLYKGFRAAEIGIVNFLLEDCYSGGKVFSQLDDDGDGEYEIGIKNGAISPYEGQDGLMREFNTRDRLGIRSDAFYCEVDFIMAVSMIASLKALGIYNEQDNISLYKKIFIGNQDFLFKKEKGYVGRGQGQTHITADINLMGYKYLKAYWEMYFNAPENI